VIIDFHTHLASPVVLPGVFFDGWADNIRRLLPPNVPPAHRSRIEESFRLSVLDPDGDKLVAEMDAAAIDVAVVLLIDYGLAFPGHVPPIEEAFAAHRALLARHPGRFVVFAGVDPRRGRSGVELFERSLVEWGFRGLKLYPPCGFSPSDPMLDPFYELCDAYRVPALVHIGPTSPVLGYSMTAPFLLDEAARRFPRVKFILAHGAVSFTEECAMLCNFRPNVFLDLSAFQGAICPGGGPAAVRTAVSRGINHKILFGTDWPVFRMQADQKTYVEAVTTEGGPLATVPERDRDLILCGNVERILKDHRIPEASITRSA